MLFNVIDYIREYSRSTNDIGKEAFAFILMHRRDVSKTVLREMMLNYRTYFKTDQKDRIVNDYNCLIINKNQKHTSDIAIGYNIVKYVKINSTAEQRIIDYLHSRLNEHIDSRLTKVYFMRKKLVLEYIEKNILIKRRT